jgi:ribose 5-phosphate isomerase A
MDPKQRAAEAALAYVRDGMVVGLGTGSTADFFLIALGDAVRSGRLSGIRGVPTSVRSERRGRELGIALATLVECPRPDVTVDGADEIAPDLDLIKGLGGALLREKIVAQNSAKLVIIADAGKTVPRLGAKSKLPVEVAKFAHETHEAYLRSLGAEPSVRRGKEGTPFETDNGNFIYDCGFPGGISDPSALDVALRARAGVVETGLFLGMASVALIASATGVEERHRGR